MENVASLKAETAKEPVKKFGREKKYKEFERRKRKSRHAKLGAYVERTLGSDTTPENFIGKAKKWIENQEMLQRAKMRAAKLMEREFVSPPQYQFRNPLAKYAFDEGGAMY